MEVLLIAVLFSFLLFILSAINLAGASFAKSEDYRDPE